MTLRAQAKRIPWQLLLQNRPRREGEQGASFTEGEVRAQQAELRQRTQVWHLLIPLPCQLQSV